MSLPAASEEPIIVSVVVPFYNEAESILPLLTELNESLLTLKKRCEIIAVDDGSTDDTGEKLLVAAAHFPSLTFLQHRINRGQAAALWTGFAAARGAIIVTIDGDGQNDPADIPRLLQALEEGADLVSGERVNRQDSTLRRWMSRIANRVRSRILGDGVHDTGCALKVFRREVCASFIPIRTLYSFIPALAVSAGFRVVELPVAHRSRKAGISKYGLGVMLWRPLVDLIGVCWFTRRRFIDSHDKTPGLAKDAHLAVVHPGGADDIPRHEGAERA